MIRQLLGSAVGVMAVTAVATAQVPVSVASGVGSFGGGYRPMTPSLSAPIGPGMYRGPGVGIGGGFGARPLHGGFPHPTFYGGGGFLSGGYYYGNYYSPYFVGPGPNTQFIDPVYVPVPVRVGPPEPAVVLAGEFPAALTLVFPAAADVWLNGEKVAGDAAAERTLTSPVLRPGEQFTFRVRARWAVNGQSYEATRDVTLGPGARSRLLIVSGTAVTEK